MNRNLTIIALVLAALGTVACGGGQSAPAPTDTTELKGTYLVNFYVNVSRPTGGTIRSSDGRINCGTLNGPNNSCSPTLYTWNQSVTLTAIPDANLYFQSWAADCKGSVTDGCVLDTVNGGADKWVVAIFNPPERLGHGDITSPSLHAPKYFAFLGNEPDAPRCTNCHGQNYAGQSIAPSCNSCHAAAGWANWQQSCSFCHGLKNATTKAGYAFVDGGLNQEWAAPPDDVDGRLTGTNGAAAGAHQAHVAANEFRSPIACSECHVVPTTAIHTLNDSLDLPFGELSKSQGAVPTWDAATLTCGSNYCHGNFNYGGVQGKAASLTWGGSLTGCTTCHDMPPAGHAFSTNPDPASCAACHSDTVTSTGAIDLAKGKHINGEKDAAGGACDSCHWYPNSLTRPATGAHLAHYGLTTADGGGTGFGDLETLEAKFPGAAPTEAPSTYAFGCGNCHPMDMAQHSMGSGSSVAKVFLYEAGAPAGSIKARNSPTAAYDASAKTCSGVYCHSSGQETPTYAASPAWTSTTPLGCGGCHGNPPRYASGGAGTASANSHLGVDSWGWVVGHVGGIGAFGHADRHGTAQSEAAITCQTCHFDTTDPSNAGVSGFYWLDTTGNYEFSGRDPSQGAVNCTSCHTGAGNATVKSGKVLPLRHVNGTRDVAFDSRTTVDQAISYLPASPNTPARPYWRSNDTSYTWLNAGLNGTTVSFYVAGSTYDPATKTCTVACHNLVPASGLKTVWGAPFAWDCQYCHGDKYNY